MVGKMIRSHRWIFGLGGAALVGFGLGRTTPNTAFADPPAQAPAVAKSEMSQRVVAYLYDHVPVTREDLGEYLIARQGGEKLEVLVNKRIIELACQRRGLSVTAAEVEASLDEDLKGINVNRKEFVDKVLKQYGKTLYEWKEDVIRPKLMLTKLCADRVKVTEEEVHAAFDSEFGPKVETRIIVWPPGQEKFAFEAYDRIRKNEEEFDKAARQQAMATLASTGGRIKPFGKGSGTHPKIEKEAFALQPGEVSTIINTPEGAAVFKVDKVVPANQEAQYDKYKDALAKVVYQKKLDAEIPKLFKAMKDEAKPIILMKDRQSADDLEREVRTDILPTGATQLRK